MNTITLPPVGMQGRWRIYGTNKFNGHRRLLGKQDNILLNSGLTNLGYQTGGFLTHCQVGTGQGEATAGETGLKNWVNGTDNILSGGVTIGSGSTPNEEHGLKQITWRFTEGEVSGQGALSEIGAGWAVGPGANVVSLAQIIDPITGNPTTVSPLPDELLDAQYEMRYYAPVGDSVGQVTLDGVDYDYIVRAANAASSTAWGNYIGQEPGAVAGQSLWVAYGADGDIGTRTGAPTGTPDQADNSNQSEETYLGTRERVCLADVGPTGWVVPQGIRTLLCQTTMGQYQIRFGVATQAGQPLPIDDPIPKTSGNPQLMGIGLRIAWAQYPF